MDVSQITQPDIYIWGVRVMEPVTAITDLMVSAMCFYAFWRVIKSGKKSQTIRYVKLYLVTMGIATTLGGLIGHAFLYQFNESWRLLGWYTSMISVAMMERASISYANRLISKRLGQFFLVLNIVELIALITIVTITQEFKYVEFHSAYGFLVVVLSFHLYVFIKTRDKSSLYMLYALGVLIIAVFVFNYPVVIHTFFNHRDLAHILMVIATYFIMKSALGLKTKNSNKPNKPL